MSSAYISGRLSDSVGRKKFVLTGWLLYALIYGAFAFTSDAPTMIAIFLIYGLYYGLTEPTEKSWIVQLVDPNRRGTAFGFYHAAMGLGALPASLLFALLWKVAGVEVAFLTGGAMALAATLLALPVYDSITGKRAS